MTFNLILFPACAISTMKVFGVGQAELTTLTSVTSVVGVFAGLIFGRMLDTKNIKVTIAIFLGIGVVLFFIRALMTAYVPVMILTFLAALCVGVCQVAAPRVVATWLPPQNVGTATSFLNAGAGLGSVLGFAIGNAIGVVTAMYLVCFLYLALWIFWMIIGGEGQFKMEAPPAPEDSKGKASDVYKSKNLWMIIIAFSMAVTSSQLVNSYMINAFVSKGLSAAGASGMGTALNLSLLLGGFIMTAVLGAVKRFNPLLIASMVGGAVFILAGWFLPIGVVTWVCVILGGLFFGGSLGLCAGRIPLIPMTGDFGPEYIGTASGFNEIIKGSISFLLPIIVAYAFGTNFNAIFIIFAICCVICMICGSFCVPELGEKGELFKKVHGEQQ